MSFFSCHVRIYYHNSKTFSWYFVFSYTGYSRIILTVRVFHFYQLFAQLLNYVMVVWSLVASLLPEPSWFGSPMRNPLLLCTDSFWWLIGSCTGRKLYPPWLLTKGYQQRVWKVPIETSLYRRKMSVFCSLEWIYIVYSFILITSKGFGASRSFFRECPIRVWKVPAACLEGTRSVFPGCPNICEMGWIRRRRKGGVFILGTETHRRNCIRVRGWRFAEFTENELSASGIPEQRRYRTLPARKPGISSQEVVRVDFIWGEGGGGIRGGRSVGKCQRLF